MPSSSTTSSSASSRTERPDAVLSLYHLLDPEVLADPYPLFDRLRREDPVHWDPFLHAWIVTRYSDVMEVLHTFSADRTPTPEQLSAMGLSQLNPIAQVMVKQMLFMDAPAHTRLRSLASKAFTPARVEKLRGHIREIVDRLLDAVEANGHMDVIAEFAEPLPAIVTAELLGVPVEDWRRLKAWSANFAEMLGNFQHNPERNPLMLRTVEEMTGYFRDAVREISAHPREGLIDSLITAEIDGDRLTEEEVIANSIVTMVGGQETTTNLIGNGLLSLLRNRPELDRLNADLSLTPSAVEEMLRYESPSQHTARLAPEDRELGGKKIEKRQAVIAVMAAANRDPERFPDPHRFDITRADNRHLAFGYAAHFCFGAPLARAEGQIAFERMLGRLRNLQLEPQKLIWRTNLGLRGLTSLKIRFDSGASGTVNANGSGKRAEVSPTKPEQPAPATAGNSASRAGELEKYLKDRAPQQHVSRRVGPGAAPLSFPQQQIWLHSQIAPGVPVYNEPVTIYRDGPLDMTVLARCFAEILRRHEAWRTTFDVTLGEPVQIVNPVPALNLPLVDLRHLPESDRNAAALAAATEDARRPFDLKQCPLLRVKVIRLADEEYRIYITLHHLIFDGLSIYQVFLPELAKLYAAFSRGQASPLPELPIQYADFAGWQRNYLRNGVLAQHLDYWRTKLAGDLPVLDLPADYTRPAVQTFQGAIQTLHLPRGLSEQLKALSKKENSTLFITLLAAFKTLLHRYTGQDDLLIGTVAGSRKRSDFENLLGCFQNPVVLRSDFSGSPNFSQILGRVRETTLGALQHDEVPFELVVKELHAERDLSRNPLVQVAFTLVPQVAFPEPGWSAGQWDVETGAAKFDLYLEMEDDSDGLTARFMYRSDLFLPETIERLKANFSTLLEGIVAHPERDIDTLPLLTAREQHQLLVEWNDTKVAYPADLLLHDLVRTAAQQSPSAAAVVSGDQAVTYAEFEARSNQLAHELRRAGVDREAVVGLYFERSIEMVIAILAVLKAGGTCLPLDPAYPADRLAFMIEDSEARLLLTQSRLETQVPSRRAPLISVDRLPEGSQDERASAPAPIADPDGIAYLIYTSGSTGQPKGVRVTHRALVNSTLARKTYYYEPPTSFLLLSSFAFDSSLAGIFWTLSAGGTLVLPPDQSKWDLNSLPSLAAQHTVSHLLCVPSLYKMMLETANPGDLSSLRAAIVAGESCPGQLVEQHHGQVPQAALYNEYGPTEAAVWCSVYKCEPQPESGRIPIGRPIANSQLYVLDSRMQPVPIGVAGELHIGGAGVSAGYWRRPELNAQKFVTDPFAKDSPLAKASQLYKTGDKARHRADGNLEWLGRMDGQVKLRGFRLELGEIETALAADPGVLRSVVQLRETEASGPQLVAYVVPRAGVSLSAEVLRENISGRLPAHAIPAAFVILEALPVLPNGKVDTRRLPAPGVSTQSKLENVAPRSPVEEVVAGIWEQVLQREEIGVREDFFALGGHSLLAAKVISRILQTLGIELPLRSIFERPTIEGLSALIENLRLERSPAFTQPIAAARRDVSPPLSFAQQRLWFLDQLEPGNPLYNVPCAIHLEGNLDQGALERSLNEIVRRHEILRTRFTTSNGQPVQVIAPALSIPLPVTELGRLPQAEREARAERLAAEEAKRSFNLGAGPLLRANLLRLAADEHVLLLNIHHIASDETSREIIVREMVALYDAFSQDKPSPLPELKTQYADYAVWQRGWLKNGTLDKEIAYWREQLQGAPAVLELPTDHSRPAVQSFRGANQSLDLDPAIAESLKALSQREGATLFMTLLAAFQVLLSRYTGQDDIVVGSPFTNRQRAEVEGLIGFFVNTVPLRADLSYDPSFRQLLHRVKETALAAYDHRELPLEKLVEELRPERNLSYNPLFQVLFAVQNTVSPVEKVAGLTLHLRDVDTGTAKFDLTCTVIPKDAGFTTSFEYNTDLFEAPSIRRMIDSFHSILAAVARDAERPISQLPLLNQKEKQRVLVEWNATRSDYPRDKCIHQLVEAQAAESPDTMAVLHEHNRLSYRELNQRANQLAHFLRKRGVGSEVPVGVCLENSIELTVALLAVLKAGGACLALDPAYPKERLQLMLEDSGAPLLLSREGLLPDLASAHTERICILAAGEFLEEESRENPEPNVNPDNLAYMIYTSGSTGKPKGVMLTHGGLVNYICAAIKLYGLRPSDRLLQFSSISFDIAIEEIFPTWAAGATLVLRSGNFSLAGSDFLRWAKQQKLTVISVATAYWHELVHELTESGVALPETLRLVIVGGEKAQIQALEAWRKVAGGRVRWLNTYGPTETSVIATSYEPAASGPLPSPLPIGRPIHNARIHILDRNMQLVPVGIPGEVHIGGPGVARGYLNHPDLTEAKFVADPFSSDPGARLYKTGDLARYLEDGQIEFVGRRDFQVKIRGFRVELGEIEAALAKHPSVRECIVLAREEENIKRLVAYVIPSAGATADAGALRKFLKKQLPEYMVPADFVRLEEFPLTPNGKVDRKALPAPQPGAVSESGHVAPTNFVEVQLVAMWEEILGKKPVGIRDNFFDLGGHSLLAVRLMRRIEQSFKRKLPLTTLFEAPTIEQFAALLQQERWTPSQSSLVPIQPEGDRPPFFCIHGLGGTVLRFHALAQHMGTDRPFYGVQAQGLEGDRAFHTKVEDMAAFYIKEIRALQPEGPYHLGGYSLGGLIAFEMSRQLQADGQEVGLLALLDTYPGKPKSTKLLLSTLLTLPRHEQLSYIAQRAKRIRKGIKRRFEALFLPAPLKAVRKVFSVAEEGYKPQVYFGSATWFRATEKGLRGVDNPTDDWSKWVTGGVEVHEIEGDHGSILKEPQVRHLAERVRDCLNRVQDEHAERELETQAS